MVAGGLDRYAKRLLRHHSRDLRRGANSLIDSFGFTVHQ